MDEEIDGGMEVWRDGENACRVNLARWCVWDEGMGWDGRGRGSKSKVFVYVSIWVISFKFVKGR